MHLELTTKEMERCERENMRIAIYMRLRNDVKEMRPATRQDGRDVDMATIQIPCHQKATFTGQLRKCLRLTLGIWRRGSLCL